MDLYYTFNDYIRGKYGKKGYRISVDAGFGCPNRASDRLSGGCLFCDETGSRPAGIGSAEPLEKQVKRGIEKAQSKYGAEVFFLYFQAYTSTYAGPERLYEIYSSALKLAPFRELIISTRPDCPPQETILMLKNIKKQFDLEVWIELGLQSIHDRTLQRINRGHDYQTFRETYTRLKEQNLNCTVHLILGLPGEDETHIRETLEAVAKMKPDGVKFHNLHIPEKSPLFREYLTGEIPVISNNRYIKLVAWGIERLPPKTVVMRVSTDTPRIRSGIYPGALWPKHKFATELDALLRASGTKQGFYHQRRSVDYG